MSNQLSQLPVEVVILPSTAISMSISQLPVEVLVNPSSAIQMRLSQLPVEVLILPTVVPTDVERTYFTIFA